MAYQDEFRAWGGSAQVARMAERSAWSASQLSLLLDHHGRCVSGASWRRIFSREPGERRPAAPGLSTGPVRASTDRPIDLSRVRSAATFPP